MALTQHDTSNVTGIKKVRLDLPPDLSSYIDKNAEFIAEIKKALRITGETLSEDDLWEMIAKQSSKEWQLAHDNLRAAEAVWKQLADPERAALGSIGIALDSDEINDAANKRDITLAQFVYIDEGLRQRKDLKELLDILVVQQRKLLGSMDLSQLSKQTSNDLSSAQLLSFGENRTRLLNASAAIGYAPILPKEPSSSLAKLFQSCAKKLGFIKPPSVPSSPKTSP